MANVFIVDDETSQRQIMASILAAEKHQVTQAGSVDEALVLLEKSRPEVLLTDLKMPGKTGLTLVETLAKQPDPPEMVVITAFGSIETAVKAMRLGAYDYLTKPINRDELLITVERAAEKRQLRQERNHLRTAVTGELTAGLVAESKPMREVLAMVEKVAQSDATVLIRGESGTGKERIAKMIHYQGPRGKKPLQSINCAAFTESLLEAELFGYEKGSFTGAASQKTGVIESAGGGTLFLDEIGDMSLSIQAKVLRVIQERELRRVGGTASISFDVRIIAATNKNLEESVQNGSFREDLFYRLNVIPVVLPPLRQRREDIPALVRHFAARSGRGKTVAPEVLQVFLEYAWPGNVRELQAVMERIIVLSDRPVIGVGDVPREIMEKSGEEAGAGEAPRPYPLIAAGASPFSLPAEGIVFEDWEREMFRQALDRHEGNMAKAAKYLGMTYRTFQYRATKFGFAGK
jgi:DNA-binding NtrC family response regulator